MHATVMLRRAITVFVMGLLLWGLFSVQSFAGDAATWQYGGRDVLVTLPAHLSAARSLVVVLHGGLGNAAHIEDRNAESLSVGQEAVRLLELEATP